MTRKARECLHHILNYILLLTGKHSDSDKFVDKPLSQKRISEVLEGMNIAASEPLLSKIKRSQVEKGLTFHEENLIEIKRGLETWCAKGFNAQFYPQTNKFSEKTNPEDFDPKEFYPKKRAEQNKNDTDVRLHHGGRRSQEYKVNFMATAQREVLEVGIRLRAFRDNLRYVGRDIYRQPVERLLARGVNFKCYLLDVNASTVKAYIEDLATVQEKERSSYEVVPEVINDLTELCDTFRAKNYPGTFELYQYAHIPQNHFFVVDNDLEDHAKMMISNYIFGIPRGQCFVIEFSREDADVLYDQYKKSLEHLIGDAKRLASSAWNPAAPKI